MCNVPLPNGMPNLPFLVLFQTYELGNHISKMNLNYRYFTSVAMSMNLPSNGSIQTAYNTVEITNYRESHI